MLRTKLKIGRAIYVLSMLGCAVIAMFVVPIAPMYAQETRDFPLPEGVVTDFTGALNETQLGEIESALQASYEKTGMDGHVIIAMSTDEWHLDEYVKDYADWLQGQGLITSTGWLLYISTDDRKFALAVQDRASKSLTAPRKSEIELIIAGNLEQEDLFAAVTDAVGAISALPGPGEIEDKKKISPDMLIFAGILVMTVALMLRLRRLKRKSYAAEA